MSAQIARAAGIGEGTIFRAFGDKDALRGYLARIGAVAGALAASGGLRRGDITALRSKAAEGGGGAEGGGDAAPAQDGHLRPARLRLPGLIAGRHAGKCGAGWGMFARQVWLHKSWPVCPVSPGLTYCLRGLPFGWSRVVPFAERRPAHRYALVERPPSPEGGRSRVFRPSDGTGP
nr:TetR family transcriptional regulator [Nonomuraea basaltis]